MEDYKEMYTVLFNRITDIIDEMQTAQIEAEDIYLSWEQKQNVLSICNDNENAG